MGNWSKQVLFQVIRLLTPPFNSSHWRSEISRLKKAEKQGKEIKKVFLYQTSKLQTGIDRSRLNVLGIDRIKQDGPWIVSGKKDGILYLPNRFLSVLRTFSTLKNDFLSYV